MRTAISAMCVQKNMSAAKTCFYPSLTRQDVVFADMKVVNTIRGKMIRTELVSQLLSEMAKSAMKIKYLKEEGKIVVETDK